MASHIGLYDLVKIMEAEYPEDLTDALVEAARKGHLDIVRHLVFVFREQSHLHQPNLERLFMAATSCSNNEVVDEIMVFMPKHDSESNRGSAWLSDMLFKACWLGNEQLVDTLLGLGADLRTPLQYSNRDIRPHHVAIQTNKPGVVKLLLERDPNLCLGDGELPRMLSIWASLEVAELLIAHAITAEAENKGWKTLEAACHVGKPIIANLLLTQGFGSSDHADNASSKAVICSDNGNIRTLRVLIAHGIDVNAVASGAHEGNALYFAISNDRLDICQLLLQHNIDVNYTAPGSTPPIVMAVSCGPETSAPIVKLLLDNGADPESTEPVGTDSWERTAILKASGLAGEDMPQIIKHLLEHSVDISRRDCDGWTPAYTAAYFGRTSNLELLVDAGADLYATCGENNWNALQAAYNKPEVVRFLLEKGMDPFAKYQASSSALQLAARFNEPICLKAMLGRSGEQKESAISEALYDAVKSSVPETARLLLDEGPDVNRTLDKRTLLSVAVQEGNEDIIRMLLEFRPVLDHEDLGDKTLLHFISSDITVSSLKLLANAGAKMDSLDKDRESPLTYAVGSGNIEAVRYLLTKPAARLTMNICAEDGTPLHQACLYASPEMIKLLIENGADRDQRDERGRKPVHIACWKSRGFLDALDLSDQDFAIRDKLGCLPLHYVVCSDEPDVVEHVLERSKMAGLDINARDNDDWTPLLWAARSIHFHKMIDFLLENGADLGVRGKVHPDFDKIWDQQWSATDVAAYHGLFDLADRLEIADPGTVRDASISPRKKPVHHGPKVWCDGCTLTCLGPYSVCEECTSFILCFKCYNSREALHPDHDFEIKFGERDEGEDNLQSKATEVPSNAKDLTQEYRSEETLDDEVVSNDEE